MSKQWKFYVAGVQHHHLHKVIKEIEEGDYLDLIPDPSNKFDPNAVRIEHNSTMLGYVPKKFSAEVSAALEIDPRFECSITKLDRDAKPWEQLEVVIKRDEDNEDEGTDDSLLL